MALISDLVSGWLFGQEAKLPECATLALSVDDLGIEYRDVLVVIVVAVMVGLLSGAPCLCLLRQHRVEISLHLKELDVFGRIEA